jgi:hypothetical protein
MVKKLSKTGKTKFEVDNLDYSFLCTAIDNYAVFVQETEFAKNSIMTKGFVEDRIKSLQETFKVGD